MAASWTDTSGNFWLFGGIGSDSVGKSGPLNDLWEFNPTEKTWTWVSGSSELVEEDSSGDYGQIAIYGTLGSAAANNVPGGRYGSVSWLDQSGNLWLFGGYGYGSTSIQGNLNDLWEFSPTTKEWTWVSGADTVNASGSYGVLGTPAATNIPGSRYESASWTDTNGNFWLYGGNGYVSAGENGNFNDLWEFDPTTKEWTWINGSSTANAPAVYGTMGTASTSNTPGARWQAVSWIDSSGNLWLFGGDAYNDLWKFNPTANTWTWVGGSSTSGEASYGTEGVAAASNVPGGREGSVSWEDSSGNMWLFGGAGIDSTGTEGYLNDLWRYQP
jgi:N-acetylneuraminic acid mutarotase